MAASTLTRTKGWTSTGLILTFSLLCLVGFASSLNDKDELKKMKETYENTLQHFNSVKATYKSEMDAISKHISGLTRSLGKQAEGLPDDLSVKFQLEYFERLMANLEKELEKRKEELIKFHEEQRGEL